MLSTISGHYFAGHNSPVYSGGSGGGIGDAVWGPMITVSTDGPFAGTSSWSGSQVNGSYGRLDPSPDLNLGTGDFTFEWFINQNSFNGYQRAFTVGVYSGADSPTTIGCSVEGSTLIYWAGGSARIFLANVYSLGVWNHVALTRESGVLKIFVNGVRRSSFSFPSTISNTTSPMWIMSQADPTSLTSEKVDGKFTNFRFVKGLAVYTGDNYTVPTGNLSITAPANPFGGVNTNAIGAGLTKILLIP